MTEDRPFHGKPSGPTWQRKIRETVSRIVAKKDPRWGRLYASFLVKQAERIYAIVGYPPRNAESPQTAHVRRTMIAVEEIHRWHPEWEARDIAPILNLTPQTIAKYLDAVRMHEDGKGR